MTASITNFSREMVQLLSRRHALFDKELISEYGKNLYGKDSGCIGVVTPTTEHLVEKIITVARKHRVPLYPISTGKNWGLGSRLPVERGHVVVDLGQLTSISGFDGRNGTVTIQAGVTQKQLSDFLVAKGADFFLNVTGSSKDSSILGNALERGVAHYGCRVREILSLQIMLGNGKKLCCGGVSLPASRACNTYPYGIGPDLRGLFFQSGFGIVTSATIKLLPRSDEVASVTIDQLPETALKEFIAILGKLNREGLIPGNLHISNRNRRLSIVTPLYAKHSNLSMKKAKEDVERNISGEWSASLSLRGSKAGINSCLKRLRNRLGGKAKISSVLGSDWEQTRDREEILAATRGTFLHASGIPSDDAIYSLGYGQSEILGTNPVQSDTGTLFIVPILPFDEENFERVAKCIKRIFRKFRFTPFMTFNLVEQDNLEAVINLTFNRTDQAQVDKAHHCILNTFEALLNAGYPPQRMSIFQMPYLKMHPRMVDEGYRQTVRSLKKIFDPDNIIARGRYEL
jgi:4-cresol dehydrogenase (hydroxylating)